jgi:hypothetical protein
MTDHKARAAEAMVLITESPLSETRKRFLFNLLTPHPQKLKSTAMR